MKVGFQGEKGAYSEQAVFKYFGEDAAEAVGMRSFEDVFEAVDSGSIDVGVVPIENFLAGSINQSYDLLLKHSLNIIGEVFLPVRHCLLGNEGSSVDGINEHFSMHQLIVLRRRQENTCWPSILSNNQWMTCIPYILEQPGHIFLEFSNRDDIVRNAHIFHYLAPNIMPYSVLNILNILYFSSLFIDFT